ncbi:MAG: bis-aminopropyl spermidine synthase family protein [Myxococcales bacterium]|nr:bis-aminopropyl spermidine synthase family protein [Myxococcales bacterium]
MDGADVESQVAAVVAALRAPASATTAEVEARVEAALGALGIAAPRPVDGGRLSSAALAPASHGTPREGDEGDEHEGDEGDEHHDDGAGDEHDDDGDDDDEEDPRELFWWLAKMAPPTHRRAREPAAPVDADLVARLEGMLAERPEPDEGHAQMAIDAASTLRRAQAVIDEVGVDAPIVAVGDDDGVTLALALLGAKDLFAVDVDPAVLGWLDEQARALGARFEGARADVFEDAPPEGIRGRCVAAVTDPVRNGEECLAFLDYAKACLVEGPAARIFWADHPDWNLELAEVLASLDARGLRLVRELPLLHAYPVSAAWVPDVEAKARALAARGVALRPTTLGALVEHVRGWTNLYVLARR